MTNYSTWFCVKNLSSADISIFFLNLRCYSGEDHRIQMTNIKII